MNYYTKIGIGASEQRILTNLDLNVQVLWNGSPSFVTSSQTINLSKNISAMNHGIILHWQEWRDSAVKPSNHVYSYIPKYQIEQFSNGQGVCMPLNGVDGTIGYKYCYIHNNKIVGNDNNSKTVTKNGITYNNSSWVLTAVLGI